MVVEAGPLADLRVVPLRPPILPEPRRSGEDGTACRICDSEQPAIWSDENWRLTVSANHPDLRSS
jgi:hypothetical protein